MYFIINNSSYFRTQLQSKTKNNFSVYSVCRRNDC